MLRNPFSIALAVMLAIGPAAVGQEKKCQPFRALSQQVFDIVLGGYYGPTFATLGDEVLVDMGKALAPVRPPTTTCSGGMCMDKDARYLYDFGNGDTVTVEVQAASYPEPPAFGAYSGTLKVVAGTGRFRDATGLLAEKGPYFAWIDRTGTLQARYNGEMTGTLCGVQPKKP